MVVVVVSVMTSRGVNLPQSMTAHRCACTLLRSQANTLFLLGSRFPISDVTTLFLFVWFVFYFRCFKGVHHNRDYNGTKIYSDVKHFHTKCAHETRGGLLPCGWPKAG